MNLPLQTIIQRLAQTIPGDTAALQVVVDCAEDTARRHEDAGEGAQAAAYWESARLARATLRAMHATQPALPAAAASPSSVEAARHLVQALDLTTRDLDALKPGTDTGWALRGVLRAALLRAEPRLDAAR